MAPSENTQKHSVSSREVLQEERYLWMSRAFVVMVVLAIICDVILLIALANVTPVLRVQPFYISTKDKNEQIIDVIRPAQEVLDSDTLKGSYVRQYLLARYGIESNWQEQETRWGPGGIVEQMSSNTVYDEFKKEELMKLEKMAKEDNMTRDVKILRVNKTQAATGPNDGDVYEAKIKISQMNRVSSVPEETWWIARAKVAFRPDGEPRSRAQILQNPLGFKVLGFGLTRSEPEEIRP